MKNLRGMMGLAVAMIVVGIGQVRAADTSRVYVEFKPGGKESARGLIRQAGGAIHHEFDSLNAVATTLPTAALAGIRNNPNVVLVEDDPPRFLYGCDPVPETPLPFGVEMVEAPDLWATGADGSGIKVGVIDSGVFAGHTDFVELSMDGYPSGAWSTDRFGHGTHVTGTIGAALNGSGVVGVSPGVSIYMVKVFGDDGAWIYSSSLLNAAQRCQAAGCRIISMSLGGSIRSGTEDRGLQQLYNSGILLVAAAGNAGDTTTSYPAGYKSVISVAAVDVNGALATFSQRNGDVELSAPGVGVLSTVPFCEVNTVTAGSGTVAGNHVEFSARGTVTGTLVNGGRALATDAAWSGKVVLVERGDISFYDKVHNVQLSGGKACVIYDNVANEELYATLGTGNSSTIPALGLSQANGQSLLGQVGTSVTVVSTITYDTSGWALYDGTSMATPHVSAAAALVWSAAPAKSNTDIRAALQATALDLGTPGFDSSFGYGLVRAKAALDYLVPSGSDTTPPVITSGPTSSIVNAKKGTFMISWTTDEASTSVVILNGTAMANANLVTSHSMTFQGTKKAIYTYQVQSTDAAGNTVTSGTFMHQN